MRFAPLVLVAFLSLADLGCGFVTGAMEVNQNLQSEDPNDREIGMLGGKLLFTLGFGTVGVLLLFFGLRWYMENLGGSSSERRDDLAAESANAARLGVLTLAVVVPKEGDAPPTLIATGETVDQLLDVIATLRRLRPRWRYVGARGTPAMQPSDAANEAARLSAIFRDRVSRPPGFRGANDAWLALVTVRAPGDFSGIMPGDAPGFESSFGPLFELRSHDVLGFTAEWIPVDADPSLVDRFPSLVRVA